MGRVRWTWGCDLCAESGTVVLPKRAGVWEGAMLFIEAHAEKSPACHGGRDTIYVTEAP